MGMECELGTVLQKSEQATGQFTLHQLRTGMSTLGGTKSALCHAGFLVRSGQAGRVWLVPE